MVDLLHGDCLELMRNIPDRSIDLILCDLPYGTTRCKWDSVIPFEPLWEQYKRVIKKNCAVVMFGQEPFASELRHSNLSWYKYDWIWQKPQGTNFLNANRQPMKDYEVICVFGNGAVRYYPQMAEGEAYTRERPKRRNSVYGNCGASNIKCRKTRHPKSVLRFNTPNNTQRLHPTQKPVALLEYLIRTYTQPGEIVLDNCMGSGSTGVACANTDRDFIGMELDEHYFSVAKDRIEACATRLRSDVSASRSEFIQSCIWAGDVEAEMP